MDLTAEELDMEPTKDNGTALQDDTTLPDFLQTLQPLRHWICLGTKQCPESGASQCLCHKEKCKSLHSASRQHEGDNMIEDNGISQRLPHPLATHLSVDGWGTYWSDTELAECTGTKST